MLLFVAVNISTSRSSLSTQFFSRCAHVALVSACRKIIHRFKKFRQLAPLLMGCFVPSRRLSQPNRKVFVQVPVHFPPTDHFVCVSVQESEEVVVRMSKPPHSDSFGFSIRGGSESNSPIYVEVVTAGTAAARSGLCAGDVVKAINGAAVAGHFHDSVLRAINRAAGSGQLELTVMRAKGEHRKTDQLFSSSAWPNPSKNTLNCADALCTAGLVEPGGDRKEPEVVPVRSQPAYSARRPDKVTAFFLTTQSSDNQQPHTPMGNF